MGLRQFLSCHEHQPQGPEELRDPLGFGAGLERRAHHVHSHGSGHRHHHCAGLSIGAVDLGLAVCRQ
ncbi:hypothetical protein D3C81_1824790 [compost metagenome]